MSAIREEGAEAEPIRVLFTLHHNMNALDFVGPLEVLSSALHDVNDEEDKAFDCEFVGPGDNVLSSSGTSFRSHLTYKDAYKQLKEYDVLVVAGGNFNEILKSQSEPLGLIRAFADLQEHNASKERTILSVDTGSLFLAKMGILQGLAATTRPEQYITLENLAQESAQKELETRTEVLEGERYVVNQGRFDLGEDLENNPYVFKKNPGRKGSATAVRKGSEARRMSNARRESIVRRSTMRLGGMRVVTAAGSTCGIDAAMYLVSALVSHESAQQVSERMQYSWQKGVVVDSIDV
ncbi:hypothetical protein OHC33_009208 [Knufia fluminis]|uniref:DJ-1/PfpI domain-containing protein n=1 Tax=Knufia fluminis TaxID=191047 RepID=A0AAN8I337_9EURO|nr:hypothetical protein OHC33_009208 [Knufia fluminis]